MGHVAALLLGVSSAASVAVSGATALSSTTDASTYTFSAVSGLGTHTHTFVCASLAGGGATFSSVTVQGSSATAGVNANNGNQRAAIFAIAESTSAPDVVLNLSTSPRNAAVLVIGATGVSSTTAVASNNSTGSSANVNANTSAGGIAIACGVSTNGGSMNWTGVTEAYDTALESTDVHSGGYATTASAGTPRTITGAWTASFVSIVVSATYR